jgi:hypothetical protein
MFASETAVTWVSCRAESAPEQLVAVRSQLALVAWVNEIPATQTPAVFFPNLMR